MRAQALFSLAWFHAVIQERRNFIPEVRFTFFFHYLIFGGVVFLWDMDSYLLLFFPLKGWSKFYEFNYADLKAGAHMIDRFCEAAGK